MKSTEYQGLIVGVSEKFGMANTKPGNIFILLSDDFWDCHKIAEHLVQISIFIKENQPKMAKKGYFSGFGHNSLQEYGINLISFAYIWN